MRRNPIINALGCAATLDISALSQEGWDAVTAAWSGAVSVAAMPRDRARMQRVLDWLHQHYDQPLRLEPLCRIAHLTDSQLQRVFKRSTRMSISQYLTQLRIGRACQMLVQTDRPLGHIATECGFSDAAHFSRQFRQARGMAPSAFRRHFDRPG